MKKHIIDVANSSEAESTQELLIAAVQGGMLLTMVDKEKLTREICFAAVKREWSELEFVPEAMQTDALYREAVKQNGGALQHIPKANRTKELCLIAVKKDFHAFWYVPEANRTAELYLEAVKQDGSALGLVPEENRTEALCLEAVKQDGSVLELVPEANRTQELCLEAVKQNGEALKFVPKARQTAELYLEAVKQHFRALEFVPEANRTEALYREALKQNGYDLGYVPFGNRTQELCLIAVKQNWQALFDVPKTKQTQELCLEAVKQNGEALKFVPEANRTQELCLEAVKQNGEALKFVPKVNRTQGLCLIAVKQNWLALLDVPETNRTQELCLEAVKKNGEALKFVPKVNRTQELCLIAVKQNWQALFDVPETKQTQELYLEAVKQNGEALKYVPEANRTQELCLEAVKKNGEALRYVPEAKLTQELYLEVVKQDGLNLRLVPENLKAVIIQKLSVASILANNYSARKFFPEKPDYKEAINQYLRSVNYIVLDDRPDSLEIRDAHLTYVHNKKNKGIVSISAISSNSDLKSLLGDLSDANNTNPLHLVLLGHASENADEIAGLSFKKIASICENNKTITNVSLLGCNVAKAKQTKMEREMVEQFNVKKQEHSYGLMTAVNQNSTDDFRKKCLDFCQKNNLDGVYVVNKKTDGGYELISMKYNEKEQTLIEKIQKIPESHISIQNLKQGGQRILFDNWEMKFSQKKLLPVRTKDNPLSYDELTHIRGLRDEVERFDKKHPKYKKDKTRHPFLAKIEVTPEELEPSLLKKVADELIKRSSNKKMQNITLQGPTKAVYVDTARKDFKVTRTHLYVTSYNKSFFNPQDSAHSPQIDYEKLQKERKQDARSPTIEKTNAKKIQVTIKPH